MQTNSCELNLTLTLNLNILFQNEKRKSFYPEKGFGVGGWLARREGDSDQQINFWRPYSGRTSDQELLSCASLYENLRFRLFEHRIRALTVTQKPKIKIVEVFICYT